ncbi:helix-turn-helix domain-containing protein [Rhodobacter capsulatus]|uniref:helix-turn-helix domain-containing protein n=1 Tax=Rhodobacter capsulatus TaxID=1061 RepID=UPI0040258C34
MSHRATNWAIQQRGLAPATKLVLWHLCDRHNPDYGCFPSQDQLAADAEISRASLNVHLDKLEQAGLIRRERRLDDDTKRQRTTRYFLGFEEGFALKPCPDSGHGSTPEPCPDLAKSRVQNLDTNPVSKEPVITTARDAGATREGRAEVCAADEDPDLDAAEAACLAACGDGMAPAARAAITATTATIGAWLKAGFDLDLDVLPMIAERTAKARGSPIRTWEYFSQAIAARHAKRIAQAARSQGAGEAGAGPAVAPGSPATAPGSQGGIPEHLLRLAAWINSGSYVPPSAFTNTTRDALLRAGLVTEATLRARQIY